MTRRSAKTNAQLMCGAASAALLLWAGAAQAQVSTKVEIAPQSLASALNEFGVQTGHQVIFAPSLTGAKTTPGVRADGDIELALTRLLDGSGLAWRRDDDTFLIVRADQGPQSGSAAGAGAEVEALIVTAQKREEDIQDVPIAISAFTQEDLTRSQIAGGPDLITQVPNMTFTKTNFSSYSVQLRGIGTQAISATTDPGVAVAFNNTPFTRNRFFEQEFYDLERVEVLRGPQGTLYGRNATAGVVNIISAKPKFRFEAKASGDVSNYNSSRIEGMVNIPLVEDIAALRLAGAWTKREGYAENELSGAPIDGRDLWSTRVSLRFQPTERFDANLIWEHFEEKDDRLRSGKQLCRKDVVTQVGDVPITNYHDNSVAGGQGLLFAGVQGALSQGCKRESLYSPMSFQRPNGLMLPYYKPLGAIGLPAALNDPYSTPPECAGTVTFCDPAKVDVIDQPMGLRVIQSTVDPDYRADANLAELQINLDITDTLTLSSETGYSVDQVWSLQDFNRFNTARGAWLQPGVPGAPFRQDVLQPGEYGGIFCDPQLGCSDRLVVVDLSTAKASQFSQEFRLSSNYEGDFNFSLGANFMRADSMDKYYVFFNSLGLVAAKGPTINTTSPQMPPYVVGISDNFECLSNGYQPGNPNEPYRVQGCIYMDPNPIGHLNDKGHNYFLSNNPYKLISYAIFGEAYYKLADNLKVTAGLRWTVDRKEAPLIPSWTANTMSVGYPVAEVVEREWREPTGRLTVDWKPDLSFTNETMVYASYAHGYKAGGVNPPGAVVSFYGDINVARGKVMTSVTRPKTFEAEFIDAYEIGSKSTFADGKVTANLAAFYYDYSDYQISEIVDRSAFNRNFDAMVWGVEIETDWRPFDNLRLGFKGGYEKTRIADGERSIDLMDRTAGNNDWLVVRPFPTFSSSCVIPRFVYENPNGPLGKVGSVGGGGPSACELAYSMGLDPVTMVEYVDLTSNAPLPGTSSNVNTHPGYPGWDPTVDYGNNNGEGFYKELGGNELPNAPNWTGTITADYTVPLPNDWLATLHTDLHWQSESWWRIFNDHEYAKLDEYFTMNLAAIFTNEERGWNIMAYVKNVTDSSAITGAFLNSDDTGLTTNVFLVEPRLYGIRATKAWTGGPLWGTFGSRREGQYPFTLELGSSVQRLDAPNTAITPSFIPTFDPRLDIFGDVQDQDLDWGDGRDVKLTWRPNARPWTIALGGRNGQSNGKFEMDAEWRPEPYCIFGGGNLSICTNNSTSLIAVLGRNFAPPHRADAIVAEGESYRLVELEARRDVALAGLKNSSFGVGLRRAQLESWTAGKLAVLTDWVVPPNGFNTFASLGAPASHTLYNIDARSLRTLEGMGPMLSWKAAHSLFGSGDVGRVDLDWSVSGGVLFGERKTAVDAEQIARVYTFATTTTLLGTANSGSKNLVSTTLPPPVELQRSEDVTVPLLDLSLGLTYKVDRFSIGAGYRWERYFDAIDGGYEEARDADRTIDGPYLKVSVGFGG